MTEFKTKRDPRIPPMPNKTDWQKFERIEQWRRSNLTIMRQLHADVYNDLNTNANDIANVAANQHAAVTVSDSSTINLTLSGQNISGVSVNQAPHVTLFPWEMTTHVGTWVLQMNLGQYFAGFWYNSSGANADTITSANLQMTSGTFRWTVLTRTGPDRGIAQIMINGVGSSIVDMYSAGYVYNVALSNIASISPSGIKTIGLKAYGKNGSSSGYLIPFSYLNLHRYT